MAKIDNVQAAFSLLESLVNSADVVEGKIVKVYDLEGLTKIKKSQGLPALALVYEGLSGQQDSSKTGAVPTVVFGIYLLGGDKCQMLLNGEKVTNMTILHELREKIMASCVDVVGAHRKWRLVRELPFDVGNVAGYVQRWSTVISITPEVDDDG